MKKILFLSLIIIGCGKSVEDLVCESFEFEYQKSSYDVNKAYNIADKMADEIIKMSQEDQNKYFKMMDLKYCPKWNKKRYSEKENQGESDNKAFKVEGEESLEEMRKSIKDGTYVLD